MKVSKVSRLTKDEILLRISDYDIYRYYFGAFQINKVYLNHLRGDRSTPAFSIKEYDGNLYHTDFANSDWRGDCFSLVQQIYNCDFKGALHIIDKDFGLGLSGGVVHERKDVITWKPPKIIEKKKTLIQVTPKRFTKRELDFWGRFELGLDDIRHDKNVITHSIKDLYINKQKVNIPEGELAFGYLFDDQYWKIYMPYSKDMKWISNVPITTMYGLSNIKNCKKALVTKSAKDYYVCKKFLTSCTAGTQNESNVAISDVNIEYLLNNSELCYLIFDNDYVGVETSKFYNSKGLKYWNVPKRYLHKHNITDPSGLVETYGSTRLIQQFTKKIKL